MHDGLVIIDKWQDKTAPATKAGRPKLLPEAERCAAESRWQARAWKPDLRKYVTKSWPTEESAIEWGTGARDGTTYVPQLTKATVTQIGKAYVEALRNRVGGAAAPAHIRQVQACVDSLKAARIDSMDDPAFADQLAGWLARLTKRSAFGAKSKKGQQPKPVSASHRKKMLIFVRKMVKMAVNRGLLARDPTTEIKLARPDVPMRKVFTIQELKAIVCDDARWIDRGKRSRCIQAVAAHGSQREAADALQIPLTTLHSRINAEPRPDPWWPFAVVAAYTGLRGSEVAAMQWRWLNLDRGRMTVPADAPGNKYRTEREVLLQPELIDLLNGPLKEGASPSIPVVGAVAEMAADPIARAQGFRDYLTRCGIEPEGRNVHALRHSYCSLMTAMNANANLVMQAAGHKSASVSAHYAASAGSYMDQIEDWPAASRWPELRLRRDAQANLETRNAKEVAT